MESDILELISGDSSCEKREPSEWLGLKSRVEEDKFRKLSADLERRRVRRFLQHAEEERKVVKELSNLQKDRLRFEREKQLRQRNSFSSSRERRHSAPKASVLLEVNNNTQLPMNQKAFGGSASLAFDPTVEKSSRPSRRPSKEHQTVSYSAARKATKDSSPSSGFPYIDEEDVQRFHKMCKSAAKSECRRWGAAWFYAKKEQDIAVDSKKRWTSLLLKSEKEKMRILSEKGGALLDRNTPCGNFGNNPCFEGDKKSFDSTVRDSVDIYTEEKKLTFHKAFSLPQAIVSKEGEDFSAENVSQKASVDCKHINSSLLKENAQGRVLKRSKKSRTISPEERNEHSKETSVPRMPAIQELDSEESSSASSEKSKIHPRRKRAVSFLPNLTINELTKS
ncbi:hypothetical protein OS493_020207 [Desmophyllum pertusum]|uniref:Uncharacterized protein n=1 Tax=Desmophyllum pertusum TaxID=174260 RepID=A0A9X0D4K2_9CNID|nr:hypothetical protein OS493_020207 [Desmophyllum pertusum]